jgi:thiol-disulfide isomerase/thioredoxin
MTIEDNGESEYELLYEKRISQPTRKMLIQLDISHQHKNMDSIMRLYDSTMVAFNSMTRQFIRNFSTKFISLDLLNYNKNVWPTDTIKTLYEHLDKRLKDFPSAKKTVNFISTTLGTRVRPFPIDSLTGRGYVNEKQNKIYLVDFWGTWCQPCLNNIPALKKYYEKYHAKGCEIISIACERDTLDYVFNAKIKKLGLPWPVFKESMKSMVDSGFFEKYNIIGYPTYLLLDNTGKIIFHFTGEDHFKDVVERTKLTLDAR